MKIGKSRVQGDVFRAAYYAGSLPDFEYAVTFVERYAWSSSLVSRIGEGDDCIQRIIASAQFDDDQNWTILPGRGQRLSSSIQVEQGLLEERRQGKRRGGSPCGFSEKVSSIEIRIHSTATIAIAFDIQGERSKVGRSL